MQCHRSRWTSGIARGSAAARLLRILVRIPQGACMSFSCECCLLSGRGLCDGPMPRPEDSYRVCVTVNVHKSFHNDAPLENMQSHIPRLSILLACRKSHPYRADVKNGNVCVCACVCVCVYVCMYVCMYVCITYVCTYVGMYV